MQSHPYKASRYCMLTFSRIFTEFSCSLYNLMTWGHSYEWDCNTLHLHVCCLLTVPESLEQKHREDESCFQWFWGWGLGRNSRIRRNVSIWSTENYNWLWSNYFYEQYEMAFDVISNKKLKFLNGFLIWLLT